MGNQRRHGNKIGNKRKRRTIDLDSLSKKNRKIYREERNTKPTTAEESKKKEQDHLPDKEDPDEEANELINEEESSSCDEDEVHPYQQLVDTLSNNSTQLNKHTGVESSDEEDVSSDEASSDAEQNPDDIDINTSDKEPRDSDSEVEAGSSDSGADVSGDDDDDYSDDETHPSDGEDNKALQDTDPFLLHFETDLEDKVAEELASCKSCKREQIKLSGIGEALYHWAHDSLKQKLPHTKHTDLTTAHVRQSLCSNLSSANKKFCNQDTESLTGLQSAFFPILNNYQDLLYTERDGENGEQLRLLYCLHALNHVLKTRKRVITHNTKIKQKTKLAPDEEYRDQGLTRPKVLMLLPFRDSAMKVVDTFTQLLNPTDQSFVANKKRFKSEYSLPEENEPTKGYKPEDFERTFDGNIDDHFRIGISVAKKTLKLYTKFYASDIIIASPLGLRTLIGSESDKERDYDFLNSIELLIIDQIDVLLMQNWDHVLHILQHVHLQPQESHDVDFSRVRMWTLNGWSKYYRQTLMFSSIHSPEITAVFNRHCSNYAGKYQVQRKHTAGSICQIAAQLPQVFHRIESSSYNDVPDDRFDFFIKKVFPHHSNTGMSQTLIFIPSYFDFVRLRNYFKREEISFLQISEYSKDKTVNTARNLFYHKRLPYLLYTERFHFYKRVRLRGIRNIIFYGLPQYPHLYSEMCNMLHDVKNKTRGDNHTCTVIYSKYEAVKLAEIVGTDRATQMIHSHKAVHMFLTGDHT